MKRIAISLLLLSGMTACSSSKMSHHDSHQQRAMQKAEHNMANMSEAELTKMVKEFSTPGQEHARLSPLVGKWKTTSKFWMGAGQEPQVQTGTSTSEWVYGKRFVKEQYSGTWNGEPFQGMGMLGYDNLKDKYVSTWLDSMGTGIMTAEGEWNPSTRSIEMTSSYSCPMAGGTKSSRMVTKIISNNEHTLEMWDVLSNGEELKMMEINYKRVG